MTRVFRRLVVAPAVVALTVLIWATLPLWLIAAAALSPILHAFGISRVLTSSSTRCVQTVAPFAAEHVVPLEEVDELSEEEYDETSARTLLDLLMAAPGSSVLCSHRPVLPELFGILGIEEEPLAPSEMVVVHHRAGRLVATERHEPL